MAAHDIGTPHPFNFNVNLKPFHTFRFLLPESIAKDVQRWTGPTVQDVGIIAPAESKGEAKQNVSGKRGEGKAKRKPGKDSIFQPIRKSKQPTFNNQMLDNASAKIRLEVCR